MGWLMDVFGDVPDPRTGNAQRHCLLDILTIALVASVCGAESCVDFAEFAEDRERLLREFLALENGLPSHDTFSRVFRLLDPAAFGRAFEAFVVDLGAGVAGVLAIDGYGLSASFRQGLSERGLVWAVGIPCKQKVYRADVTMIFPVAGRGRPRKRHVPDTTSVSAQAMLEEAPWRMLSWRWATKGCLKARFAARRVRAADGPPQRIGTMGAQHLQGEEVCLIGEHRSNGDRKYYLSSLPADTSLTRLAGRSRRAGSANRRISS